MAIACASWASAEGARTTADPADPAAPVPAEQYRSAFAGYRRSGDEPIADWRASNAEVGRIGGWRAYAREARSPEGRHEAAPKAPAQGGHAIPGGGK